jgi:hypothetical protein
VTRAARAGARLALVLAVFVSVVACGSTTRGATPTSGSTIVDSSSTDATRLDTDALRPEVDPIAAPLGWEVQHASTGEPDVRGGVSLKLYSVYLRPTGAEPTPGAYLAISPQVLAVLAPTVLRAHPELDAIDLCLERANTASADEEPPAMTRLLVTRDQLAATTQPGVRTADLLRLARNRLIDFAVDPWVQNSPEWPIELTDSKQPAS